MVYIYVFFCHDVNTASLLRVSGQRQCSHRDRRMGQSRDGRGGAHGGCQRVMPRFEIGAVTRGDAGTIRDRTSSQDRQKRTICQSTICQRIICQLHGSAAILGAGQSSLSLHLEDSGRGDVLHP